MSRALSVSRVTVSPDRETEYLAALQKLAAVLERRGQHVWVFRSSDQPGTFLEFNESPSPLSHRARASRTGEELRIEMTLQSLATYAPGAWDLWEEVPLGLEREPSGEE
jgi:hypothetical protein